MRPDMAKVIVERPRHGARLRHRKGYRKQWQRLDPELWPKRENVFAHKGRTKSFNEHLGPLRRYLRKQVGRPWDLVYSEICANLRVDSVVQSHVRDHLDDYVETCVIDIDGVPCHGSQPVGRPLAGGRKLFFVCPRTGLLRANELQKRRPARAKLPVDYLPIDARHEYRLMEGLWYEVTLRSITAESQGAHGIVLDAKVRPAAAYLAQNTYGWLAYAVRRRQLNKREIRRLLKRLPA